MVVGAREENEERGERERERGGPSLIHFKGRSTRGAGVIHALYTFNKY
jgi:hypothetical protein